MVVLPAASGNTGTVAVVAPAETVIVGGTVATLGLLLTRLTTWPLEPAAAPNVRVKLPEPLVSKLNGLGPSVIGGGGTATIVTVDGLLEAIPSLTINCAT